VAYQSVGKRDLALPLLEETLRLKKAKLGPDHPQTHISSICLAHVYLANGKSDLALPLYETTLQQIKSKLGPEHPDTLCAMHHLAFAYQATNRLDLALPLYEQTLQLMKAKLGPEHHSTLSTQSHLGGAYQAAGKLDLALPLLEETLRLRKAKLGPEHPDTLNTMHKLASAYQAAGKRDLALPLYEETLQLEKANLGPEHPNTLITMNNFASAYKAAGKLDLALPLFEETLQLMKAKLGSEHPNTLIAMHNLASAYQAAGKLDPALPLYEETLQLMKARLGPEHPDTRTCRLNLARAYQLAGRTREAVPYFTEASTANPQDTLVYLKVAALQAWFGQAEEFRVTRRRILESARDTHEATTADRAAKACSLLPSTDTVELEAALALGRKAVELGKGGGWNLLALGMAEYRIGNYAVADKALSTAQEADKGNPWVPNISAFYRALCLFRQDKIDEARRVATEAAAKMKPLPEDEDNPLADNANHDDLVLWLAYKEAQALIRFDTNQNKLVRFLKGEYQPATNDERLSLAELCRVKKFRRAAAGLYADAFAADPKLADDLPAAHRYHACCAAACAAAGQAADAANLDDAEQARLRQQALAWLRADLALRSKQLESGQPAELAELLKILRDWQNNLVLAGLRDSDRVAKLPAQEREACEKLWADVAAVIGRFDETVRLLEAEIRRFAALSPAAQVEEVRQELKRRNANFDGALTPVIKNGVVTQLTFSTDRVQDIAPVRKLTQLQFLEMNGSRGPLDLSPLQGLRLTWLSVMGKVVPDLTPLRGMPLQELYCEELDLTDLSPISQLPLTTIRLRFQAERDAATLRGIKTLTRINDMPAAEFWKGIAK